MDVKRTIFLALLGLFVLQFVGETHAANKGKISKKRSKAEKTTEPIFNNDRNEDDNDVDVDGDDEGDGVEHSNYSGSIVDFDENEDDEHKPTVKHYKSNEIPKSPGDLFGEPVPDQIHVLFELISRKIVEYVDQNQDAKETMEKAWNHVTGICTSDHGSKLIIKISDLVRTTLTNENGQKTIKNLAAMITQACIHDGGIETIYQTLYSLIQVLVSEKTIPAFKEFNNEMTTHIIEDPKKLKVLTTLVGNLFITYKEPIELSEIKTANVKLPHLEPAVIPIKSGTPSKRNGESKNVNISPLKPAVTRSASVTPSNGNGKSTKKK